MAILKNVTFFYTKIANPVPNFDKTGTEWVVDCAVSKADAKAFKKEFKKASIKEYDNEEFLTKFAVKVLPFPDQEEQFILKIKKAGEFKDGNALDPKYYPRVFEQTDAGAVDVTQTKMISNGSKGQLSYRVKENTYGKFAELTAILVEDLIEYKSKGGGSVGSDFNVAESALKPIEAKVVNKQEEAFHPKQQETKYEEDDLDSSPF